MTAAAILRVREAGGDKWTILGNILAVPDVTMHTLGCSRAVPGDMP